MPAPEETSSLRLPVRAVTLVVPIQLIDPAAVEQISEALRLRRVSVRCRSPIPRPRGSYDARRRQLKADVLLQRVAEVAAERPAPGITDADCYAGDRLQRTKRVRRRASCPRNHCA
jgi:predicted Zn-dependent protease